MYPVLLKHTKGPNLEACANLLEKVYCSEQSMEYIDTCDVPLFSIDELEKAMKQMRRGRCEDKSGIVH